MPVVSKDVCVRGLLCHRLPVGQFELPCLGAFVFYRCGSRLPIDVLVFLRIASWKTIVVIGFRYFLRIGAFSSSVVMRYHNAEFVVFRLAHCIDVIVFDSLRCMGFPSISELDGAETVFLAVLVACYCAGARG